MMPLSLEMKESDYTARNVAPSCLEEEAIPMSKEPTSIGLMGAYERSYIAFGWESDLISNISRGSTMTVLHVATSS